jgi:hypothetical protein
MSDDVAQRSTWFIYEHELQACQHASMHERTLTSSASARLLARSSLSAAGLNLAMESVLG